MEPTRYLTEYMSLEDHIIPYKVQYVKLEDFARC